MMTDPASATAPMRVAKLNDAELVSIRVAEKIPPKVELLQADFAEFSPWRWEHLPGSKLYLFERQALTVGSNLRPEVLSKFSPDGDKNAVIAMYFFTLKYDRRDGGYTDTDFTDALRVAKGRGRLTHVIVGGVLQQIASRQPIIGIAPAPPWLEEDLLVHLGDLEKGRAATEDALKVVWDDGKPA